MSELIMHQLRQACADTPEWSPLADKLNDPHQGLHLAVMNQPYLDLVFDGTKTTESRFSMHKVPPYGQVAIGDLVFLKHGSVVGAFTATSVNFLRIRIGQDLRDIKAKYGPSIAAPDKFWQLLYSKRFVTLIGIGDVLQLPPVEVTKKDRRGWVVLRDSTAPTLPL